MGKSRFIELMAKSLDQSASKEELKELEVFYKNYPNYKKLQQITYALGTIPKDQDNAQTENDREKKLDKLWVKINSSVQTKTDTSFTSIKTVSLNFRRWLSAAAAIVLVATVSIFWFLNKKTQTVASNMQQVYVPYGKTLKIVLSDGTKVTLNAGSRFSYPAKFAEKQREVKLNGEGFFEVAKNAKRPFLVHTIGLTVKVLGTVFNLKAYTGDKKIETTLLEGKVQVDLADEPDKKIILLPNEKLTVSNDRSPVKAQKTGVKEASKMKYQVATLPDIISGEYQENAWINNEIIFTNQDFDDVAEQMERKYDVSFVFEDEGLKTEQISGVLKNESLDAALKILKMTTSFKSRTEGKTIYLSYISKH